MRKLAKNRTFPIRSRQAYGKRRRSKQAGLHDKATDALDQRFILNKKGPRHLAPGAFYLSKK